MDKLAKEYSVELTTEVELVEKGWVSSPKGLLQVPLKRGWINTTRLVRE